MQISLYIIAFITPVIVISGLQHFKHDRFFAFNFLAVALISLEVFKFFYNASIFPMGETPAEYMPLTIVTVTAVMALFGAFIKRNSKLGAYIRNIILLTAFVPMTLVLFNDAPWYRSVDTLGYLFGYYGGVQIGMIGAIYFVQCGLILAYAFYVFMERKQTNILKLCLAVAFVSLIMGATILTNYLWSSSFVFTSNAHENILVVVISFLAIVITWCMCVLKCRAKGSSAKDGDMDVL